MMQEATDTEQEARIDKLIVSAYTIPTETPEADGTISWESTTMVLVKLAGGGKEGIGYTYAPAATATYIQDTLCQLIEGENCFDIPYLNHKLMRAVRNSGTAGITMMAVSAIDNALWDLKAKILDVPLCVLLGKAKNEMLLYGSGGFTNYSKTQLQDQLGGWANEGLHYVKMKIGAIPEEDLNRVRQAKEAVGEDVGLFVDANGAYTVKQALEKAHQFREYGVSWFEEPVRSDNLKGLRFIREHGPAGMNIAAGEYGYNPWYFETMISAGAVDVLQADATRCGGISNFLKAGHLCEAHQIPFSSHCAPSLHLHAALSMPNFYIAEYFYDHARIEKMLFDGVSPPVDGALKPDLARPGLGLVFKEADARQYEI